MNLIYTLQQICKYDIITSTFVAEGRALPCSECTQSAGGRKKGEPETSPWLMPTLHRALSGFSQRVNPLRNSEIITNTTVFKEEGAEA